MLLVKDFKIQLQSNDGRYSAKAWNAHCQFQVEDKTSQGAVSKAVQGCLEYTAAKYLEAVCLVCNSTNKIVYKNLPFVEMQKKMSPAEGIPIGDRDDKALVEYEGRLSKLDVEIELCHGFKIVRVVAIREITTVPPMI